MDHREKGEIIFIYLSLVEFVCPLNGITIVIKYKVFTNQICCQVTNGAQKEALLTLIDAHHGPNKRDKVELVYDNLSDVVESDEEGSYKENLQATNVTQRKSMKSKWQKPNEMYVNLNNFRVSFILYY